MSGPPFDASIFDVDIFDAEYPSTPDGRRGPRNDYGMERLSKREQSYKRKRQAYKQR
jgi:hypothetical protein